MRSTRGEGGHASEASQTKNVDPPSTLSNLCFGLACSYLGILPVRSTIEEIENCEQSIQARAGDIEAGDLGRCILRSSTRGFILTVPLSAHRKRRIVRVIQRGRLALLLVISRLGRF